jgi:hypothetical protein
MQHIHNAAKLALDRYRAATVDSGRTGQWLPLRAMFNPTRSAPTPMVRPPASSDARTSLVFSSCRRIRNWKHRTLYCPTKDAHYQHIDSLFFATVEWQRIATHLPDMLRLGVSTAAGTTTPSTILRRLSAYSRKNRLYLAFRELRVAVRTGFLLQHLGNAELRSII